MSDGIIPAGIIPAGIIPAGIMPGGIIALEPVPAVGVDGGDWLGGDAGWLGWAAAPVPAVGVEGCAVIAPVIVVAPGVVAVGAAPPAAGVAPGSAGIIVPVPPLLEHAAIPESAIKHVAMKFLSMSPPPHANDSTFDCRLTLGDRSDCAGVRSCLKRDFDALRSSRVVPRPGRQRLAAAQGHILW
jgi:hypothetical protein